MDYQDKQALILYQVYPKSFYDPANSGQGTLQGIIDKIPYFQRLGVSGLWLSPFFMSPMADNGYDISDYLQVHPDFGTLEDLKTLIRKLHEANLVLMIDLVFNHTSDEHPWFVASKQSRENPYSDYYIWRDGKKGKAPNNWTSFFTGSAWTYVKERDQYYLHLFNHKQPDLNFENPKVMQELIKVVHFYQELGVDGFRLDVINLISKVRHLPNGKFAIALQGKEHYLCGPSVHEYVKTLSQATFIPKQSITVGETVFITKPEAIKFIDPKREELDMVFHFDHMNVDSINNKWFLRKFKPHRLRNVLFSWQEALNPVGLSANYLENHDQPRSVSRFGNDKEYHYESATLLAMYLLTLKGVPFIYQGQEIGMTNAHFTSLSQYKDVETHNIYALGRNVLKFSHKRMMKKIKYMSRDNARTPVQWSDSTHAGFTQGTPWIEVNPNHQTINVKAQIEDPKSIFAFYQALIALRKKESVLTHGTFEAITYKNKHIVLFKRVHNQTEALIVLNHRAKPTRFSLDTWLTPKHTMVLSNNDRLDSSSLNPYEARLYIKKEGSHEHQ